MGISKEGSPMVMDRLPMISIQHRQVKEVLKATQVA